MTEDLDNLKISLDEAAQAEDIEVKSLMEVKKKEEDLDEIEVESFWPGDHNWLGVWGRSRGSHERIPEGQSIQPQVLNWNLDKKVKALGTGRV